LREIGDPYVVWSSFVDGRFSTFFQDLVLPLLVGVHRLEDEWIYPTYCATKLIERAKYPLRSKKNFLRWKGSSPTRWAPTSYKSKVIIPFIRVISHNPSYPLIRPFIRVPITPFVPSRALPL